MFKYVINTILNLTRSLIVCFMNIKLDDYKYCSYNFDDMRFESSDCKMCGQSLSVRDSTLVTWPGSSVDFNEKHVSVLVY